MKRKKEKDTRVNHVSSLELLKNCQKKNSSYKEDSRTGEDRERLRRERDRERERERERERNRETDRQTERYTDGVRTKEEEISK